MSLRLKIILALAALASVASVAIGVTSYRTTRAQLLNSVDQSLTAASAVRITGRCVPVADIDADGDTRRGPLRGIAIQVVRSDGSICRSTAEVLPVNNRELGVAASGVGRVRRTVSIDGEDFRMLTVPVVGGGAVQFARPLTETNQSLSHIARRTMMAVVAAVLAAMLLGWWLGRHITRRLQQLTFAAQHVADTGSLDPDIPVEGHDEVATLGQSMRSMLAALGASRDAQRQLVQDAGHELRTPLTSLRTNVSVLRRFDQLPDESRKQILDDLDSETRELTSLVNELVDLATERAADELPQRVVLADIAGRVAERAQRRSGREVLVVADDSVANVRVNSVERAVQNLVDNALKFAPEGPVHLSVSGGRVTVRDHGPGLTPGDEDKVFQRFYRAVGARSLPGSGLGLSIVSSVAEVHGGTVFAANAPDGGAQIGFTVPLADPLGFPPPQPSA